MKPQTTVKALIPLKHHSERVPGKNTRPLCGRPLFHWIMDSLSHCRHVAEIVLDTDSEEIARDAQKNFKVTVLMRPEHLLGDMVGINPLISNQISRVDGEFFLQTHATNPLLKPATIDAAIEAFFRQDCDSLFSVNVYKKRLYRADLSPVNHDPKNMLRTQDLEPLYEENSNIYVFSRASFLANGHRIGARPAVFPMNPLEALDIDDESDFRIVGSAMSIRLAEEGGNDKK